jgi:L-fuconolactonase
MIDAHIHLRQRDNCFAQDYLSTIEQSGHNIVASVYVECGMSYSDDPRQEFRPVAEMGFVLEQANQSEASGHRMAAGIVGAADLTLGARVQPVLEALAEAANGRLRGVRYRVAWDPDPVAGYGGVDGYPRENVLGRPELLEGARCLEKMGLHLETWGFHTQLSDLARLAARVPDLSIVINHCGGPLGVGRYAGRRDEVFKDWLAGIKAVANAPNVFVKVSGLGVSRLGFGFQEQGRVKSSDELVSLWSLYVRTCIEEFGPQRALFATNYPVDAAAAPLGLLINAYKKMLLDLTPEEFSAVFAGNAKKLYRL